MRRITQARLGGTAKKGGGSLLRITMRRPLASNLMALSPFAPMRRLNVGVPFTRSIDPFGSIFVTGELERVDNSIIVQDADFEISVRWRN